VLGAVMLFPPPHATANTAANDVAPIRFVI
jgi:hypothetical protein